MQAHARLMARQRVTRQDAIVAVSLVEACSDPNVIQTSCPADPDIEHLRMDAQITNLLSAWQETLHDC